MCPLRLAMSHASTDDASSSSIGLRVLAALPDDSGPHAFRRARARASRGLVHAVWLERARPDVGRRSCSRPGFRSTLRMRAPKPMPSEPRGSTRRSRRAAAPDCSWLLLHLPWPIGSTRTRPRDSRRCEPSCRRRAAVHRRLAARARGARLCMSLARAPGRRQLHRGSRAVGSVARHWRTCRRPCARPSSSTTSRRTRARCSARAVGGSPVSGWRARRGSAAPLAHERGACDLRPCAGVCRRACAGSRRLGGAGRQSSRPPLPKCCSSARRSR